MDVSLKVIVVGNGMVGKTSMITRFAKGVMTDNYKKTIGTDFMEKDIVVRSSGENIKLMLWDTAGQEMFSQLTRNYYRGAGAVVYVFSTVDRESFLEVERWRSKVENECGHICSVLVQNKIDLLAQAQVTKEEAEDLARRMNIKLYRTCVKDNLLVDDVFEYLAEMFLRQGGASSGIESVANIGDIPSSSASSSSPSNAAFGATAGVAAVTATNSPTSNPSSSSSHSLQTQPSQNSFQLTPLTVRTGGKKKSMCNIA